MYVNSAETYGFNLVAIFVSSEEVGHNLPQNAYLLYYDQVRSYIFIYTNVIWRPAWLILNITTYDFSAVSMPYEGR